MPGPRSTAAVSLCVTTRILQPLLIHTMPTAGVEVLAEYALTAGEREAQQCDSVIVAVRSGHLMATAFHPELTQDPRWHELFVEMVRRHAAGAAAAAEGAEGGDAMPDPFAKLGREPTRPADMPVY